MKQLLQSIKILFIFIFRFQCWPSWWQWRWLLWNSSSYTKIFCTYCKKKSIFLGLEIFWPILKTCWLISSCWHKWLNQLDSNSTFQKVDPPLAKDDKQLFQLFKKQIIYFMKFLKSQSQTPLYEECRTLMRARRCGDPPRSGELMSGSLFYE